MGLKNGDLGDLIYHIVEIDSYKSKMGDDKDIVTLSFSVKEKTAGDDLMNFLEKGYAYILDADVTAGEQSDGTYKVFVELERNKQVPEEIVEIIDGVSKLGNVEDFKYRYYKNFKSKPIDIGSLEEDIPLDSDNYGVKVNEANLENYKNFFSRSYVESIDMWDDVLTISKKWADPLSFRFVDFGPTQKTLDAITESFNANDFAEIIFLSKYVGDYNITKYGSKLTFENNGQTLVVKRI